MKPILFFCGLLIFFAQPALAAVEADSGAEKPIEVVATFSILGDLVRQVGGGDVRVTTLVGPDADAHVYKTKPADVRALTGASLFVINGLNMEGWALRLVDAAAFKGVIVVASDGLRYRQTEKDSATGHQHADHGGDERQENGNNIDPHAWQSVDHVRVYVRNIAQALIKAAPARADALRARAKAYDEELVKLDAWIKAEMDLIPLSRRKIVTSHDAFGYFGDAYGVSFISPQGISTEIEPTAMQAAALIKQMRDEKVRHVFFENMNSPKLIRQLAQDVGARVGRPVYSDALSDKQGPAATYIAMMRHNVSLFKEAMMANGGE